MSTNDNDKSIEILEALFDDLAEADADDESLTTDQDHAHAEEQLRLWDLRIAKARQELLPAIAAPKPARPIRAKYQAMNRAALDATFNHVMRRTGGQLLVAYRNLSDLSDDDVRRLLETLDAEPEEP